MFVRYTKRAEADANAVGGRLQFIVVELTSYAPDTYLTLLLHIYLLLSPSKSQTCLVTRRYLSYCVTSYRVAEIDATAVHYLYNLVRTNRDRRLMNPITNEEESCPVTVLFANPSIQVVRQFEKADLVSFIGVQ